MSMSSTVESLKEHLVGVCRVRRQYSYCLIKGKSVWLKDRGYPTKTDCVQIGVIRLDDPDEECLFNEAFLNAHPEFRMWRVFREGRGSYRFVRKTKEELANPPAPLRPGRPRKRPAADAAQAEASVVDTAAAEEVKTGKFGAIYVLRSFFESSLTGRMLKRLIPDRFYEVFMTILSTGMLYGFRNQAWQCNAVLRDHVWLNVDNVDKDTIQRLFHYLDKNRIFERLFQLKADWVNTHNQELVTIALDGTNVDIKGTNINKAQFGKSKSGKDSKIINLLTLLDQHSKELYGVLTYGGAVNDVSTIESICRGFHYNRMRNIRFICDRGYWSIFNVSTMLDYGYNFLLNCNTSRSSRIQKMILQEAPKLMRSIGTPVSHEAGGPRQFASTREVEWSYTSTTRAPGTRMRAKLYLHFIFSNEIDQALKNKLDQSLEELNNAYWQGKKDHTWVQNEPQHHHHPDLQSRHYELFDQQLIQFDKELDRFIFNWPKVMQHRFLTAARVLVSSFCKDPKEAAELYRNRNNVEVNYGILKNNFDARALKASTEKTVDGKLGLAAICTELELQLRQHIKDYNAALPPAGQVRLPCNSLRAALSELDSIEAVVDRKNRQLLVKGGVLNSHNELMKALGVKPLSAMSRISMVSDGGEGLVDTEDE